MAIYYDSIFGDLIGNSVEYVDNQKSPRFIKSHLPVDLLPFQLDEVKPKVSKTRIKKRIIINSIQTK